MKNIVITGASSSIGLDLIKKFSKTNSKIICQINKSKPNFFRKKKNIFFFKSNFSKQSSLQKFIKYLSKNKDFIDLFIHLPSSKLQIKKIEDYSWLEIQNQINIQVRSFHLIIKKLIKNKNLTNKTKIIVLGSEVTKGRPPRGMLSYICAKGLLNYYCLTFQEEFKKTKLFILNPGMFESPLLSNLPKYFIEKNTKKKLIKDQVVKKIFNIVKK